MTKLACVLFTLLLSILAVAPAWGRDRTITNSIGMKFVLIPAGSFMMGGDQSVDEVISRISPEFRTGFRTRFRYILEAEHPRHRVVISRPFYLQTTEVTQAQYRAIMGSNPSHFKGCDRCPVDLVSWRNAREFIRRLNAREKTNKYRLPTEAEWEYAARAGTRTPFYFGATISTNQANYNGDYVYGAGKKGVHLRRTTPVGSYPPNRWGLYDMHGNVREWCHDRYARDYYKKSPTRDPRGPRVGSFRVLRGGSFSTPPRGVRSARRFRNPPWAHDYFIGFRVARDL